MSWDEISSKQYRCPCGLGTYTIKLFMDDWNSNEERSEMDCLGCRQNFNLYTYDHYEKGLKCKSHLWVSKSSYEELIKIQDRLEKTEMEAINFAVPKYMNKWL